MTYDSSMLYMQMEYITSLLYDFSSLPFQIALSVGILLWITPSEGLLFGLPRGDALNCPPVRKLIVFSIYYWTSIF